MDIKFFKIGDLKFKLECINNTLYEVVVFSNDEWKYSICFNKYESALEEILNHASITYEEWEDEE